MEHRLNAGRVAVHEEQVEEVGELVVYLARRLELAVLLQPQHPRELLGQGVADNGNHAHRPTGNHRESECVVAAYHVEAVGLVLYYLVYLFQTSARLLHRHDVLAVAGESHSCFRLEVHAGAPRHVIQHHRHFRGGGDGLEVLVKPLLRWFVVIRAYAQHAVDAGEVARAQFLNHRRGVVAAAAHKDRHFAVYHLYHQILYPLLLVLGEGGCLARRGEDAEEVGAVFQLILHKVFQRGIIHRARVCEWSDEGYAKPPEYVLRHVSFIVRLKIHCKNTT